MKKLVALFAFTTVVAAFATERVIAAGDERVKTPAEVRERMAACLRGERVENRRAELRQCLCTSFCGLSDCHVGYRVETTAGGRYVRDHTPEVSCGIDAGGL